MLAEPDIDEMPRWQTSSVPNSWQVNTIVVVVMFFASRIGFYLAGIRMSFAGLPGDWQLLDLHQLRKHLITSILNLHSQPPLFNTYTGILLRFPQSLQHDIATDCAWLLGLILILSAFNLLLELEIPRTVALAVVVILLASPAFILYENWYFYTYTTAVLLTFGALALVKFVRQRSIWWGGAYSLSLVLVIFANSTFQWPWMLLGLVPVVVVLRSHWKALVQVTLLPIILVVGWYAKDAIMFHTFSTSSWLGMNMTHVTTDALNTTSLEQMVAKGQLTKIVLVPAFSPVSSYVPGIVKAHPKAGARVLNSTTEDSVYTNFNNINFIAISNAYLHNDLRFILQRPGTYLSNISKAVQVFVAPPEEYLWVSADEAKINTYTSWFDKIIMLQPGHMDPGHYTIQSGYTSGGTGIRSSWLQESYTEILMYLATLFVLPVLLFRRRFRTAPFWALSFILLSTAYTFLATNLFELGENNRFQMDLGPLPLIATVAVCWHLYATRKNKNRTSTPIDTVSTSI